MAMTQTLHTARWWKKIPDGRLECFLCPRRCHLAEGQAGFCFVRENVGGELVQMAYGRPVALAVDPIEKKPLFHFHPGSAVLSLGTAGCNLGCQFCQNYDISKERAAQQNARHLEPRAIVDLAVEHGVPSIAFTYNEPTVWAEYAIDIARAAHEAGLHTAMVSNGYVTREAFFELYEHIDAVNIDLKGFSESFYERFTLSHMHPVLDTLRWLRRETKVWLEITNLLIPGCNDRPEETRKLCEWISIELGDTVPLHFSAFHPDYRMLDTDPTPPETVHRAREIALECGLKYVYEGNLLTRDGGNTHCPACHRTLVRRNWHRVDHVEIVSGCCAHCGQEIPGQWD
ncbi:MAG: AmmeMemoRadiSam system radical SAM enzyme [Acidobacteriota bacterium]|nr:AmmeMemoRadiSam system radical SAM enzyme [Acidobacteriota bacterium]